MPTAQSTVKPSGQSEAGKAKAPKPTKMLETAPEQTSDAAQSSAGLKTPPEQPEFLKQALVIIEKKVRNLEKRRQKLEEYKENQKKGVTLNEDQLAAVSKYEEVLRSLELAKELEKQFVGLANEAMKQQKKQLKKEQMERDEQIKEKIKEAHKLLTVLDSFGDEVVRNDFLNETNGAFKLSEQELQYLDEFNKLVGSVEMGPKLDALSAEAADHLVALIEAKNKPITSLNNAMNTSLTYQDLKKLFDRIQAASYWLKEEVQQQQAQSEAGVESSEEQPQENSEPQAEQQQTQPEFNEASNQQSSNEGEENEENKHIESQSEQTHYLKQNTSDDFVIVNASEVSDTSKGIEQQQQSKAFFTTLSDIPPHQNINEFLNRCENNEEGINFLQDSEIQQEPQIEQHPVVQQPPMPQQQQTTNDFPIQQQTQENFYNHDMNQNEGHREFKQRVGHREYNGSQSRGGYQQRPRYADDRRGGAPQQPRNGPNNGAPHQRGNGVSPYNNRNSGGGYRGGASQGTNGNRGGYYRGGQSNQGPRNPRPNYPPRNTQDVHQHQPTQVA